jgi:UDP-N-acetylglucosamine 2-epimerase
LHNVELSSIAVRNDRNFAEGAPQSRVEAKGGLAIVPVLKAGAPAKQEPASAVAEPLEVDQPALPRVRRRTYRPGVVDRPLICLVDSASDFLKAGTLAEVFLKFPGLPHLIAFHPGSESSLTFGDTGANELPMPFVGLHVEGLAEPFALRAREVLEIFDGILTEFNPQAVLAMGNSDAILASSLLANKRGIGFFRVAGGQRRSETGPGKQMNGALIDKISDALYVDRMDSYYTLYQEGIKSDRVLCVGNLVGDMLKHVLPHAPSPAEVLTDAGAATDAADSPSGYLLVTVGTRENIASSKAVLEIVTLLCELGRDLPVIWPVGPEILEQIRSAGLKEQLREANVTVLPLQGYLQLLGLLEKARCLVCGVDDSLLDEAMSLRIPSVTLGFDGPTSALIARAGALASEHAPGMPLSVVRQEMTSATSTMDSPVYWDSGTATRIANHLLLSLPKGDKAGVARG